MKKSINIKQFAEDGFVELKTLRQYILKGGVFYNNGLFQELISSDSTSFIIRPGMLECFGKVVRAEFSPNNSSYFYCPDCGWFFPTDLIKR